MKKYELLEHTADIKFKAKGKTLEELFLSCGKALLEVINSEEKILEKKEKKFEVTGHDNEELLLNFLEEFLYILDADNFLATKIIDLRINNKKLSCIVLGDNSTKYKSSNHVKAITYSGMKIKKTSKGFECSVVLDV